MKPNTNVIVNKKEAGNTKDIAIACMQMDKLLLEKFA